MSKISFKSVLAVVLSVLGKKELSKTDEGKFFLEPEDKIALTNKFGEKFVTSFEAEIPSLQAQGAAEVGDTTIEDTMLQLSAMKTQLDKALAEKSALQEVVTKLSFSPEDDAAAKLAAKIAAPGSRKAAFKPNMNLTHNRVIENFFNGDKSMMYSTDETINTAELEAEFGKYVTSEKIEILRKLTGDLTCTDFMTTVVTDKEQWRASQAIMESVLQQFTPYWTPSKGAKFTPITIDNFFLKVNVPIKPADIIDQYIGYLYDENMTPEAMPIVRYIVDVLVLPKLMEDLEEAMCTGEFVEFNPATDGEAAPVGAAMASMDGYWTIVKKLKAANKVIGAWLLDGITLTSENILTNMDKIHASISKQYRKKKLSIYADPDVIRMYNLAYRDKFPTTKNQDAENLRLDFTNFTFQPVDGMIGTGGFFLTPKENWKHLMSKNPNEAKVYMQVLNYDVKVFIEFRKGTGFAMQEALFAYVPPTSGSTGSEGSGL